MLLLMWGWVAGVGCLWVWVWVGLLLLARPLLLIWLPLLPELLMLPLSLRLLPGWCFCVSSPRGCLACVRAKLSRSRGSPRGWSKPVGPAKLSIVPSGLATRGSY